MLASSMLTSYFKKRRGNTLVPLAYLKSFCNFVAFLIALTKSSASKFKSLDNSSCGFDHKKIEEILPNYNLGSSKSIRFLRNFNLNSIRPSNYDYLNKISLALQTLI